MGDSDMANELRERGIQDDRVLSAIASLTRADFVPPTTMGNPTGDHPLPIGFGQTVSQPYIVAFMSAALNLGEHPRVLEIGTGSGYQAAVLARMGAEVFSVEIVPELAVRARQVLRAVGLDTQVRVRWGDGAEGWPEAGPFDGIILTASPGKIPSSLLVQLKDGGILVGPEGRLEDFQELVRFRRHGDELTREHLLDVRFVPMTGAVESSPAFRV
jgi:protein-L-isoaspartate(D-aspartate) O-methyltransferase